MTTALFCVVCFVFVLEMTWRRAGGRHYLNLFGKDIRHGEDETLGRHGMEMTLCCF